MINNRQKRRLKREMMEEKVNVILGKNGITKRIVDEVARRLKRNELVKVKALRSCLSTADCKSVAETLAKLTESLVVEVRGHTMVLFRKKD